MKYSNQDSKSIPTNNKTDSKPEQIIQEVEEVQSTKPENMMKNTKKKIPVRRNTKAIKKRLELKPFDDNKSVSRVNQ